MAKRRPTSVEPPAPTMLVKSRAEFSAELKERIRIGTELLESVKDFSVLGKARVEYDRWHDYNVELLKQSFSNPYNEYCKTYDDVGEWRGGIYTMGASKSTGQILGEFTSLFSKKLENLKQLDAKVELLKPLTPERPTMAPGTLLHIDRSQVFIVHGRDEAVKQEVARFVEKLDLQPIILHEQPSGGRTIIEKIEAYTNVGFAIILYTPCDIGGLKEEKPTLRDRARQNVVFEHGFLIGKIGRKNVCALVKGDMETPNDISGVVFIPMDRHWKIDLAKELKSSGYEVDLNKAL
jgi:predicted nucleotide-binding protein